MTNQTEIAGQNGHYQSAPCTAQELITWIETLTAPKLCPWDFDRTSEHSMDQAECLEACKSYLEWYNGSNQT